MLGSIQITINKYNHCMNNYTFSSKDQIYTGLLFAVYALFAPFYPICLSAAEHTPIPIKVVVVAMFEPGEKDDEMGKGKSELDYWVDLLPLDQEIPFPQGFFPLRGNDQGVLGVVTGIGTAKAAATIMALGMDPRFDLSKAYWVVSGIAGGNPEKVSLGSAAWAEWLVDGDIGYHIDSREIPKDWPTGYIPLYKKYPYEKPAPIAKYGAVYRLNPGLVEWAFQLTKDVPLEDNPKMKAFREKFVNYPIAQKPSFVLKGDNLTAMTFWHGKLNNDWARDWVDYWTEGQGEFVTSAMEETGTYLSLEWLAKAGKVDIQRLLVLRTVSNFTMQHSGITAVQSLIGEKRHKYAASSPALKAGWLVGSKVVFELLENWKDYAHNLPQ